MRHALNPLPPITSKADLERYLKEAAMLEHQFMCQYLYAAFSLKKDPDDRCGDAEFEYVRRWASTIYRVARQEMEHLSVVNSILTAVGGQPYFGHDGRFPTQSRWYVQEALVAKRTADDPVPCDIPFRLERFSLATARRYACMESPHLDWVLPEDKDDLLRWCYQDADGQCPSIDPTGSPRPVHAGVSFLGEAPDEVEIGTVQDLYEAIAAGLRTLEAQLGAAALFSGHCSGQSEIPSEFDIYLFPICDLASALAGIKMVTTQGEGIDQAPGAESHYQFFVQMAREYEQLLVANPAFEPSRPLPPDPTPDQYTNPATAMGALAFRNGYFTLLAMLTGYYARYTQTAWSASPYLLQMLEQTAFSPMMTMLIRSLAEVVAQLPANDGGPAGISFDLSAEELAFLGDPTDPRYADPLTYLIPLDGAYGFLQDALAQPLPDDLCRRLTFIVENLSKMARNLMFNYQRGIFPRFDPNNPATTCAPAAGCDCD